MDVKPGSFSVVGMAAVVAGTTHAPFSAVLILFEMTSHYPMILPLMCASVTATLVSAALDPDSVYIKKLTRRGEFPKPIRLSAGAVGWPDSEIQGWLAERAAAR